jgi:hypothetical protein
MADISDIIDVLANFASGVVYPSGTASPSIAAIPVSITPGWPIPAQLDQIIAAGGAMVSVYPIPGMDANTTQWTPDPVQLAAPVASLTLTVSSNTVTVGGTIKAGEAATVLANNLGYSYGVLVTDTTATIATALAGLIPNATAAGSIVTITGLHYLSAVVSAVVPMQQEIGRQKRVFKLIFWCPTPISRNVLSAAVDVALKAVVGRRLIVPTDNTYAKIIYRGTVMLDDLQKTNIYRRDLMYEVEYFTTLQTTGNTVTNLQLNLTANNTPAINISAL